MGRSKKEKARWGGGQRQQQPWPNGYPQQAEALGSTKATGVTGHQGLRPPFPNHHGPQRKGKHLVQREVCREGRRVCSTHSVASASPAG